MQETLKKNDELEVVVDRLGVNGEGIAKFNGQVIFVPFVLPAEKAKIHIINDKNSFLIAKLVELKSKSDERVLPKCPYFEKCGGCDIQHMTYASQLKLKSMIVKDTLSKYAKIDVDVPLTISSEKQFRYRNKFAFPVQSENGILKIGMYRKNSHSIIEINDCLLQSERVKKILKIFKEYMFESKISGYDEKTHKGTIKHIVLREFGENFILTVVVTDEKFNNFTPLINKLKQNFDSFGIVKNINKLGNNVIFGEKDIPVYGLSELNIQEFGINYTVNNRSFLQVNDDVKHKIYEKIIELSTGKSNVIDAYSGAGLLSSILAKHAQKVVGVEIVKQATENANKLKEINKLENLTNINGDCAEVLPKLVKSQKEDFLVVLDPPRKGVDKKVVDALIESSPSEIIYLSCNPATLARDMELLSEKYKLDFISAYDMFPQTANVETLVKLSLKV